MISVTAQKAYNCPRCNALVPLGQQCFCMTGAQGAIAAWGRQDQVGGSTMKEYCTLNLQRMDDMSAYPESSNRTAFNTAQYPETCMSQLIKDGWIVIASAIQVNNCTDEVKYRFIMEREGTK
jgi:hypothetical protein